VKDWTVRQIEAAKPGRHRVSHALYLIVSPDRSTRRFIHRYTKPSTGRVTEIKIGFFPVTTLKQAKDRVIDFRRMVADGRDPVDERARCGTTFADVAADYIAGLEKAGKYRNARSLQQLRLLLLNHASSLASRSVADIGAAHIAAALHGLWLRAPDQERRARAAVIKVLRYGKAQGLREAIGDMREDLKELRPVNGHKDLRHHKAMPYQEVPGFMQRLRERHKDAMSASAIRLLVLAGCRASEVAGMAWCEIDFAAKVWTVPASRMKAGREHRVPLSDQAVAILQRQLELKRTDFVWSGRSEKGPINSHTLYLFLTESLKIDATIHGFRSSFRDWAGNETHFDRVSIELCLAHKAGDATELAYRRSDSLEKRRVIMDAWASFCGQAA
jgi:integrase